MGQIFVVRPKLAHNFPWKVGTLNRIGPQCSALTFPSLLLLKIPLVVEALLHYHGAIAAIQSTSSLEGFFISTVASVAHARRFAPIVDIQCP